MEKTDSQPDAPSDDLHAILNRFRSWTGRLPANTKTLFGEGVREISCEEAMRLVRSRRAAQTSQPSRPSQFSDVPKTDTASPVVMPAPAPSGSAAVPAADALASGQPKAAPRARKRRETSAPATAPTQARASAHPRRQPSQPAPQFRDVILRSAAGPAASRARKAKAPERTQRVSVRLSAAEESLLLQEAAKSGITVSEYLRLRALPHETAHPKSKPPAMAIGSKHPVNPRPSPPPVQATRSSLGDWLALLRHRFLAAPARFAERA